MILEPLSKEEMGFQYIVLMKTGSHLYGTDTPESDTDYKGVYLPTSDDILLQRTKNSLNFDTKSKSASGKNSKYDIDMELYSLQRYLELLAKGDTGAVDMLFCPEDRLIKSSEIWKTIRANKDKILSRNITSFIGYCKTMADKYGVKGERLKSVKTVLSFFQHCHPQSRLTDHFHNMIGAFKDEELISFGSQVWKNTEIRYVDINNRKFQETVTVEYLTKALEGIYASYGERAKKAETADGVDWKALSHAYRICVEGIELFRTGEITLPLKPEERIITLAIKKGEMPYQDANKLILNALATLEEVNNRTILRHDPDYEWIDQFILEVHRDVVQSS